MNTLDIPATGLHLEYAAHMDELSADQFLEYCRLFIDLKAGKINQADFFTLMAVKLLDMHIPAGYKYFGPGTKDQIHDNLRQVVETITWLLIEREADGQIMLEPNITFARNLVPAIGKMIGPADALQNVTLGEFRDAIGHARNFSLTGEEKDLDRLCAVLYREQTPTDPLQTRPADWNGDTRYPYNAALAEHDAIRFAAVPLAQKYGVYLVFNAALNFLRSGTVNIEGQQISFGVLWEGEATTTSHPGIGMAGVLFSLAETGVFGTLREVERVNLYEGLARLYQVVINAPKTDKTTHD